jgi:hypothetical protein
LNWKQYFAKHKEQTLTILVLITISLIAYGNFRSRIISSDDWSFVVAKYAFGNLIPFDLADRRPLVMAYYSIMSSIFGLRFEYFYVVNFLVITLSALLVYAILSRVYPEHKWLAGLVTLAYLVYPVDYSRTWVIMTYIRLGWLINLCAIWLLLDYLESGKFIYLLVALIGIVIPLGAYEGQFGLVFAVIALIALTTSKRPILRRLTLVGSLLAVGVLFVIWRFYIQPNYLKVTDTYVEEIQFGPTVLVERYLQGLKIFILEWFNPIKFQLISNASPKISLLFLFVSIFYIALLWLVIKLKGNAKLQSGQKSSLVKFYFKLFLIGGVLWLAGYFPIIALYDPSLNGYASRVNVFAIPGASLSLISGLAILATLLVKSRTQIRLLTAALILPLIIGGIYIQLQINRESQLAWETQTTIWNSVFEAIPNIQENKELAIVIPGYDDLRPLQAYPFLTSWEINDGARVLYNNPRIGGCFYYKDTQKDELHFTTNGFRPLLIDDIIPYKKLIFVYYDPQTQSAKLIENLEETFSLPFITNNYNPRENIKSAEPSTADFRWLVQ